MWENSHLNPRELTSFFGALSPLAWEGGLFRLLPRTSNDKATTDHADPLAPVRFRGRARGSKLAWGQQVSPLAPRPLPPTRHTPASACPKTKCGLLVAESHVTGVVLVGEVMNAVRKHKQNDGGYPSMHVILCLAASLCLCPPAHHTPRVHTTHTHTASSFAPGCVSLCLHHSQAHTRHAHTHTPGPTRCAHTHPHPIPPPMNTQPPHAHPYNVRTHAHAHTQSVVLCLAVTLCLCLCPHATHASPHTHTRIPPRPDPHTTPHPPPPPTYTHTLCCPWPACVSRPLSLPPPPQAHARAAHSTHATPPGHVTDTPHTASPSPTSPHCVCSCPLSFSFLPSSVIVPLLLAPLPPPSQDRVPLR